MYSLEELSGLVLVPAVRLGDASLYKGKHKHTAISKYHSRAIIDRRENVIGKGDSKN